MCAKLNETNVTSKVFALNIIYMIQQQRKDIEKDGLKKIFLSIHLDYIPNTNLIIFMSLIRL